MANQTTCRNPRCILFTLDAKLLCHECVAEAVEDYLQLSLGENCKDPSLAYILGFQDGLDRVLAEINQIKYKVQNREVFPNS